MNRSYEPYGTYSARVDEKGRLKLPADFARFLGEEAVCFITSFDEKAVRIYPAKEWERVRQKLQEAEGQRLLFVANRFGDESQLDAQSRLLVPAELRRAAKMESRAVRLAWQRDHIKVLTEEQYEQEHERAEKAARRKRRLEKLDLGE